MDPELPQHSQASPPADQDPDPISLTLALMALVFGGGSYLETRRQRKAASQEEWRRFRGAWRNARDGLASFERQVERFEGLVEEFGFGDEQIRFGAVRLFLPLERKNDVRGLQVEILATAGDLTRYLDELSDHLDEDDDQAVQMVRALLEELGSIPNTYREVVTACRAAVEVYGNMLNDIGRHHDLEG